MFTTTVNLLINYEYTFSQWMRTVFVIVQVKTGGLKEYT